MSVKLIRTKRAALTALLTSHSDTDVISPTRSGALPALGVGVLAFCFQLPFFNRWFSTVDEGHMLVFADIIAKGGELYRDATLYPLPGAFYMLAQAFRLLDTSIIVSRWIVVVEFSLFAALVFLLVRRMVSTRSAAVTVLLILLYRIWAFPHWHIYSYSSTSLLLLTASMVCMVYFFDGRQRGLLVASGLLFGLSVYCKQDYGAAGLLAMGLTLVVFARSGPTDDREPLLACLAWFLAPAAAVGAGVGLYFGYHGLLGDLLQLTIFTHLRGISLYEYTTYPSILPLFRPDPEIRTPAGIFSFWPGIIFTVDLEALRHSFLYQRTGLYDTLLKLFFWGPYPLVLGAALRVWLRRAALSNPERRPAYLRELLLASFSAAAVLLLTLNRPQDYLHLAVLYWPMLCLGVLYGEAWLHRRRTLALALALVLAVPATAALAYSARLAWRLRTVHSVPMPGPRAGIYAMPSEVEILTDVVEFIQSNSAPDETVAVIPYYPIVQFLADRPGPHRSGYVVWPFAEFEDRDRRIIEAMEAQQTQVVVYNFTQFLSFPRLSEFAPELFEYLVDHFDTQRVFAYDLAGYKLAGLLRGDAYRAGEPLLEMAGPESFVRIESADRPPLAIAPGERSRFARRERWPFRRVLAQRPSLGDARTLLSLPLTASATTVLHTAVGVHPEKWFDLPAYEVRFDLEAVSEGHRELLYTRTLDPHVDFGHRRWFDVEIPLGDYAGRPLRLEFSTSTDREGGQELTMGGWGEPRIVHVTP
jgi:hypothetical protein